MAENKETAGMRQTRPRKAPRKAKEAEPDPLPKKVDRQALEAAQDLIYEAWEARTAREALAMARKALALSPHCSDAYNLIAEWDTKSPKEALELYRRGVAAGRQVLAKKGFKSAEGYFWGYIETRPFMRSMAGMAECLWSLGEYEEAVGHFQEMLRLNANDNQGIRYILLPRLIELGRDQAAESLYMEYENDGSAFWHYSRVLLDLRKSGDTAATSLKLALERNPHVPSLLLGEEKLPRKSPATYCFGAHDEAVIYTLDNLKAWTSTEGALDWLRKHR